MSTLRAKARAALGRPEREVVLHPVALEHRGAAVVAVDRAGDGDGALRIEQAVAFVGTDLQVVGDAIELRAGHVEHRP